MPDAYDERRRLFRSRLFHDQVADRLQLDGSLVAPAIKAMIEADMLPCRLSGSAQALAVDGAVILAGIGSRRSHPASIVRAGTEFCGMTLRCETGGPKRLGVADIFPNTKSISFGTDVAEVFMNLWKAAHGSSTKGFKGVAVAVHWSDTQGSVLLGTIEQSTDRKRIYASRAFPASSAIGEWDFVQISTVGGTVFSPRSILRFGALLDASVDETAAEI